MKPERGIFKADSFGHPISTFDMQLKAASGYKAGGGWHACGGPLAGGAAF